MNQNNTELPEKKDVREIKVINLEEVSDKFEVEDVYGKVTIHEHKTK